MKFIKLNYDWMLLDVAIPAGILDATADQHHQHAPEGKVLHVFTLPSHNPFNYKVFAYTYVDRLIIVQDDENYQEDIQLLAAHYSAMLGSQ